MYLQRDHPRVCGKNAITSVRSFISSGSPPRVREKLATALSSVASIRITPACAGKTYGLDSRDCDSQDHPRVCGKNTQLKHFHTAYAGSPPRVREKLRHVVESVRKCGITPACAGKTVNNHYLTLFFWDHPRVCGKNFSVSTFSRALSGSPPRVREKP